MEMSEDAITDHKCDQFQDVPIQEAPKAPKGTEVLVVEAAKDEVESGSGYRNCLYSTVAALFVGVSVLACHHIICPVVALKVGAIGASKVVASKSAIHHFISRVASQCCCCSCGGCNGCCPCGTACCSCAC